MRTKMIYTLLWWPSWYLLFFMHGTEGELQWVVTEKISIYGQSSTLFCLVDNCCIKRAGWSYESKTIFIDVKEYLDDPNLKYGGTFNESGFGLIIRNLSETDVNKTYECVYGFQKSTHQYLLQEDVFKKDGPSTDKENSTTDDPSTDEEISTTDEGDNTTKIVVPVLIVLVLLITSIGIFIFCLYRRKQHTKPPDTNSRGKHRTIPSTSASGGETWKDETLQDDQHDERQNTNQITVKVMKKTLLKDGKRNITNRIEMLLCDRNNCIEAFAKGDTLTSVGNTLEKDKVYKISDYKEDSFKRIEFTDLTQFIAVSDDETISYNSLAKKNISGVKQCRAKEKISLHPVIITSIGPTRQPRNTFLKEIMLKDDSGKVIMEIWSIENYIDFQFSRGDVIDLYNVTVGIFNANSSKPVFSVRYYQNNSEIISSPLEARKGMERLLEHEDPDQLKPIEMTVQKLSSLKVEKHLVIVTAGIEKFTMDEEQMFFVMNCDEVLNHGYLEQQGEKWYCKECGEYRTGNQMLELKATIADDPNVTVLIILYNEASKVVLGTTDYNDFLTCDRDKRIRILQRVQRQYIDYTFEINHAEFNHVKKAVIKHKTGANSTSETKFNN